jgi:phosphate transporter
VSDLRALDWHVLLLLGGGGALGRAIRESGLLHEVGNFIIWMMGANASPFALLAVFVAVILILTNFVSHTVASITMMPVVVEVVRCSLGKAVGQLPQPLPPCLPPSTHHPVPGPYVLPCVLATSAACVLPVSSFPNIFTSSVQLADGKLVLSSSDYVKIGTAVAAAFFVVFAAIAYPLSFSVIKSC